MCLLSVQDLCIYKPWFEGTISHVIQGEVGRYIHVQNAKSLQNSIYVYLFKYYTMHQQTLT